MSDHPERSEWDRRGEVRETLGHLSEAVAALKQHEDNRLRIMLGLIVVVVAALGLVWRAVDRITTDHDILAAVVAHQQWQDTTNGVIGTGLILSCTAGENAGLLLHDTLPLPDYAMRAVERIPTCVRLHLDLAKRLDGMLP